MTSTKRLVDDALQGYVTAALWSSNDESDESGGEPLDANYSEDDIAPSSMRSMRKDVVKFIRANKKAVREYLSVRHDRTSSEYRQQHGSIAEHLGHDLWLTRNGHGTGFWDRDYGGEDWIGEALSKGAKKLGSSDMYVGDDGKVYVSPER